MDGLRGVSALKYKNGKWTFSFLDHGRSKLDGILEKGRSIWSKRPSTYVQISFLMPSTLDLTWKHYNGIISETGIQGPNPSHDQKWKISDQTGRGQTRFLKISYRNEIKKILRLSDRTRTRIFFSRWSVDPCSEIADFSEKSNFLEISIFEWVSPDRISFVKIWVIIIGGIIRVYRIFRLVAQARLRIMQLVSVFLCKFMYFLSVWNKRGQKKRFNWFSDDVIIVVCLPDISSIYRTFSLIDQ